MEKLLEYGDDHFNPRSYKRSDFVNMMDLYDYLDFNPRSYKRSDFLCQVLAYPLADFNPRSYKRSDGKNAQLSLYLSVIIIA